MTRTLTLFALVPALALGLAACGSSNTDTGTAGSSPTSSTSSMPMLSQSSTTTSTSTSSAEPSSSTATSAAEVVIMIDDFTFKAPASVAPGATITVKNGDSQAHTVTSKEGGFDAKVDPKDTVSFTAPTKAGSYTFVCSFHADMKGTLVVK